MITKLACIICNQNNWISTCKNLIRCKYCGLTRSTDQHFLQNFKKLYDTKYYQGRDYYNYQLEEKALTKNFKHRLSIIRAYKNKGVMLDIGCAYGYFLKEARKIGFNGYGIEINPQTSNLAHQNSGCHVYTGNLIQVQFKHKKFDVVTLFDVIEHLPEPQKYLQKIYRLLKPGGILVIETGDINSPLAKLQKGSWRLIIPQIHLFYFSTTTLTHLLLKTGFKILHYQKVGFWRTVGQIGYRSFGQIIINLLPKKLLRLPLYLNTGDLVLLIAQK